MDTTTANVDLAEWFSEEEVMRHTFQRAVDLVGIDTATKFYELRETLGINSYVDTVHEISTDDIDLCRLIEDKLPIPAKDLKD
jgi:hypothetical protein